VIFFTVLLVLWEVLLRMTDIPDFILPPPRDLYTAFIANLYVISIHSVVTFTEAVGGFALSFIFSIHNV
jgi:ABC-type nitrate/sulfonate/bicarbonate transport system permease component